MSDSQLAIAGKNIAYSIAVISPARWRSTSSAIRVRGKELDGYDEIIAFFEARKLDARHTGDPVGNANTAEVSQAIVKRVAQSKGFRI